MAEKKGRIFVIMGKSASGKDAIFKRLLEYPDLSLNRVILYTTRPIRQKESDGVEYHFVTEEEERRFEKEGRIIELRAYDTVHGRWAYFTADDGQIDLERGDDYLVIGTLDSLKKLTDYYTRDCVVPIYIETEDSVRLERAIRRERKQAVPKYEEMCRRFLADAQDFSEEKLKASKVKYRFTNEGDIEETIEEIVTCIRSFNTKERHGYKDQ